MADPRLAAESVAPRVAAGEFPPPPARPIRSSLFGWHRHAGDKPSDWSTEMVEEWVHDPSLTISGARQRFFRLRGYLRWLIAEGVLEVDLTRNVAPPRIPAVMVETEPMQEPRSDRVTLQLAAVWPTHETYRSLMENDLPDLAALFARPAWQARAACRAEDPSTFFIERGASSGPGKAMCAGCPVREECLDFALEHSIKFGVWGGKSERERRQIRRGQQPRAA